MPKHITTLSIFLASPSDVATEREIVKKVISELNTTSLKALNIQLELINWEKSTYPSFGNYAQAVINEQIGDEYDIFLGIIWARLGTPTPNSVSGTVEEFERAYKRINSENKIEISFYFKIDPIDPYKIDTDQLKKVIEFKQKLNNLGGYHWDFASKDFEETLRHHLFKIAQNWNKHQPKQIHEKTISIDEFDQEEIDDVGIYDLFEDIMELIISITENLNSFNELTIEHNKMINYHTKQLDDYPDNFQQRKKIINASSKHMHEYSRNSQLKFNVIENNFENFLIKFDKFLEIYPEIHNPENALELKQMLISLDKTITAIPFMVNGNRKFLEAVKTMPRITTNLNRSKKLMIATLEPFIQYLENLEINLIRLQERGFCLLSSL